MIVVREIDREWYEIGHNCGMNSRFRLNEESPDIIRNYGKQGVVKQPTPTQQVSYILGLLNGRHEIAQSLDGIYRKPFQNHTDYKSLGKALTLGINGLKTEKGATISLPIYIENNRVDYRGFYAFQFKLKYNPKYLTFQSVTPSSLWTSNFEYQHDTTLGIVLVKGEREEIGYEDMVVGYINFVVSADASSSEVIMQGPKGKDDGSNLRTKISGEDWYLMPLEYKSANVTLIGEKEQTSGDLQYSGPFGTSSDIYGEEVEFEYDFEFELEHIQGGGSNSGGKFIIEVIINGIKQEVIIPVEEGQNRYKGKVPLRLPSISTGPVILDYRFEPEDPEDCYIWFVKAGALWNFTSEIPRENINQIPITLNIQRIYDKFVLSDILDFITETEPSPPTPPTPTETKIDIVEIMQLFDDFNIEVFPEVEDEDKDSLLLSDDLEFIIE